MPFCPRCRFEYRPGMSRCPDCGAALVERLPPEPSLPIAPDPEAIALVEARTLLTTVTGEVHARLLQDALRAQGLLTRLQAGAAPPFAPWIPAAVTAAEQRPFAIYVRPQDLARARRVYADFESAAQPVAEDEEEGSEPPFDLMGYLRGIYGRDIPRLVKDLRWLLLAVVVLDVVGTIVGYRGGAAPRWFAPPLPAWMFPFLRSADRAPGWLHYFLHNSLVAVYDYVWGALSVGLVTLYLLWTHAQFVGWTVALRMADAHAAAGSGAAGTAAGLLLPQSLVEVPAVWLIQALGVRAGLAWIWPLPGRRRWQSAAAVFGQFRLALLVVIPMLFVAAVLETEACPWFYNRYVVGLGRAPGMRSEGYVGPSPISYQPAWSPDSTSVAMITDSGHELWTRRRGDEWLLLAREESKHFTAPAWSSDSRQIAVLNASPGVVESALLIGLASEKGLDEVPGGPDGRYLQAAWDPSDRRIGVLVEGEPAAGNPAPRNLWTADLRLNVWEQLTHFPAGVMSRYGFCWSPDGRQIAFARQKGPRSPSTQLWLMDRDGGHLRRLTSGAHDAWPAWSPDGKWIAFLALPPALNDEEEQADAADGGYPPLAHICLVHADGTERRDSLAAAEGCPSLSWSADGRKLFYLRLGTMIAGEPKPVAHPAP